MFFGLGLATRVAQKESWVIKNLKQHVRKCLYFKQFSNSIAHRRSLQRCKMSSGGSTKKDDGPRLLKRDLTQQKGPAIRRFLGRGRPVVRRAALHHVRDQRIAVGIDAGGRENIVEYFSRSSDKRLRQPILGFAGRFPDDQNLGQRVAAIDDNRPARRTKRGAFVATRGAEGSAEINISGSGKRGVGARRSESHPGIPDGKQIP